MIFVTHEVKSHSLVAWGDQDSAAVRRGKAGGRVSPAHGVKIMSKQDWKEGTVQDFLGLSDVDMAMVETKVALTRVLRRQREASHLTQSEVARAMRTSQSRMARIEAGDPSVSLDLVFKALYTVGVTPQEIGRSIRNVHAVPA